MFHVKICGITSGRDAEMAAAAGADAVGLNFYRPSPRCIDIPTAEQIVAALPADTVKVGLFVNADSEEVRGTFDRVGLDLVQLHGDEPPEFLLELGDRPVMRAFRCGDDGLGPAADYLDRCRRLGCEPRSVLIDAYHPEQYGGTGTEADWPAVARWCDTLGAAHLTLAGGLNADNAARAIAAAEPSAVDTASSVESAPGKKDASLVRAFVAASKAAFERLKYLK